MSKLTTICLFSLLILSLSQSGGRWYPSNNLSLNDPISQKLFKFCLDTLSSQNDDFAQSGYKVTKIFNTQTQVTSGTNYKVIVELTSTNGTTTNMAWIIFYQPWTDTIVLLHSEQFTTDKGFLSLEDNENTDEFTSYRSQTIDMDDPILKAVLQCGLDYLDGKGENGWMISQVTSYQVQDNYRFALYQVTVKLLNPQFGQTRSEIWTVHANKGEGSYSFAGETGINPIAAP